MANLNEKQLLLLDTLIYLDDTIVQGASIKNIIENIDVDKLNLNDSLTKEEAETLIEEISKDQELMDLKVSHYEDGEIRAACFVNPETDVAVIVYRGTGSAYVAWDDNCQGGYLADTDMQEQALAFAQECAQDYDNITVTGHSKGGNMAQYVTVLMGDEIERCVSFDGQGFGDEFLEKYDDEIEANKHKIRNVCAYNDYVNILLNSIAGETVYLDNEEEGKGGHYIFDLYTNENNVLDENGEFVTSRNQDKGIIILKTILNGLLSKLDSYDAPIAEFLLYSLAGVILGSIFSEDKSIEIIVKEFLENLGEFIDTYISNWIRGNENNSCNVNVDTEALRNCSIDMNSTVLKLETLKSEIQKLQKTMATNIIDGIAIGVPLQVVIQRLDTESMKLEKLAMVLCNSADYYDSAEATAKQKAK